MAHPRSPRVMRGTNVSNTFPVLEYIVAFASSLNVSMNSSRVNLFRFLGSGESYSSMLVSSSHISSGSKADCHLSTSITLVRAWCAE
jgi:hypothetical protein